MPFGLVTNIVGAVVLLLWIPIRQKPGIGTVLNVLLIGPERAARAVAHPRGGRSSLPQVLAVRARDSR